MGVPMPVQLVSNEVLSHRNPHAGEHCSDFGIVRRGRDSNPRYLAARWFSRPVHSTTLPPLRGSIFRMYAKPYPAKAERVGFEPTMSC